MAIHYPRSISKSHYGRNLIQEIQPPISANFPKHSGFDSLGDLIMGEHLLTHITRSVDVSIMIHDVQVYTAHHSSVNRDFIFNNIELYLQILNVETGYNAKEPRYYYNKALDRLVSIMIYRKSYNHEYNLPKALSKRYVSLELALNVCINNNRKEHGS